jgi:predicted GIY-YIG superfamily endonuclease
MNSGVYLLKSPYKGIEMLKIGCSKNVLSRVKTHKSSNPLAEFIGYIETDNYK